jgi:hypothetical protein
VSACEGDSSHWRILINFDDLDRLGRLRVGFSVNFHPRAAGLLRDFDALGAKAHQIESGHRRRSRAAIQVIRPAIILTGQLWVYFPSHEFLLASHMPEKTAFLLQRCGGRVKKR